MKERTKMPAYLRKMRFFCLVTYLVSFCGCATFQNKDIIKPAKGLPETTPWGLKALSKAPCFQWADKDNQAWSLYYQGLQYKGKPTRVFAYYSNPAILNGQSAKKESFPAVVLVHGGGGRAFKEWAVLWAQRGYAAIAMDLAGWGPQEGVRIPDGGPSDSESAKFDTIEGPINDIWSYQAVANVILAHSLIRSFDEVDANKTAITGISWGGYLTCIVAGLDNRFKAAVPVYGCGFLYENSCWFENGKTGPLAIMNPQDRKKWVTLFDPSMYVGFASMPMFFVNGTNDFAYPLDSYEKTYQLVRTPRNFRITVNMPHSHIDGWAPKEIGAFIDQYLINGTQLPVVQELKISERDISAQVQTETKLTSAQLHYTTDTGSFQKRQWQTVSGSIEGGIIHTPLPPKDATVFFITVTDERNMMISSKVVFTSSRKK